MFNNISLSHKVGLFVIPLFCMVIFLPYTASAANTTISCSPAIAYAGVSVYDVTQICSVTAPAGTDVIIAFPQKYNGVYGAGKDYFPYNWQPVGYSSPGWNCSEIPSKGINCYPNGQAFGTIVVTFRAVGNCGFTAGVVAKALPHGTPYSPEGSSWHNDGTWSGFAVPFPSCSAPSTPSVACSSNSQCGTNGLTGSQFCQGNGVYQNYTTYTCNNAGTASSSCSSSTTPQLQTNCSGSQTCNSGTCTNNASVTCSSNSQCGSNGFTGSQFCQGNGVYQNFTTYTCNNAGNSNSNCSSSTVAQQTQTCTGNQTCSNGSCFTTTNNTCISNSTQRCSGNAVYWYDSCGNQQGLAQICSGNQTCSGNTCINSNTTNTSKSVYATESGRNLSSGNLNWAQTLAASPSDVIEFRVLIQSNGSFTINNVIVKEVYPANISNYGNLTLDGVAIGGDITQGINIGSISPGQTKTITYQARVAQAQNFSFGTTTILDLVTISSTDSNFLPTTVSPVSILVSKSGVLGASTASTGLTNYFWVDSFFLPLALALLGIWLYRSKFIGVPSWVGSIQLKNKETSAQKELQNKIAMIRKEETK